MRIKKIYVDCSLPGLSLSSCRHISHHAYIYHITRAAPANTESGTRSLSFLDRWIHVIGWQDSAIENCSDPRAIAEPSPGRHRATRAAEGDDRRGARPGRPAPAPGRTTTPKRTRSPRGIRSRSRTAVTSLARTSLATRLALQPAAQPASPSCIARSAREHARPAHRADRGDTRARVWGWGGGGQPARTPRPPPVRPVGSRRTSRRPLLWATSCPLIWACAAAVLRVRRSRAAAQQRGVSSRARAPGRSGAAHDLVCLPHEVRTVRGGVGRGGAPHRGRAGDGESNRRDEKSPSKSPRSEPCSPVQMLRAAFSRASRAAPTAGLISRAAPTPALWTTQTAGLLSSAAPTPALCAVQLMPKEARRSELNAWLREGRQLLENTLHARRPKTEVQLRCPASLVRSPATATITTRCRRVCSLARTYSHATTGSTSRRPPKSSPTRSRSSSHASTTCTCGGRQKSGALGPTNP